MSQFSGSFSCEPVSNVESCAFGSLVETKPGLADQALPVTQAVLGVLIAVAALEVGSR